MSSSLTPITDASSNGADTSTAGEHKPREHGMAVLRDREAKSLISLSTDALYEASNVANDLHGAIYGKESSVSNAGLQQTLAEVLTCMERAEHYLLMLGSNFKENAPEEDDHDPWAVP